MYQKRKKPSVTSRIIILQIFFAFSRLVQTHCVTEYSPAKTLEISKPYYMSSSVSGQDEPNLAL